MARTLSFTDLSLGTVTSILLGDGLVYTPLGLNTTARKFDSEGNALDERVDAGALLVGYNTTTVPPLDPLNLLGAVDISILLKSGNSTNDTMRATGGNDIIYWDYATLFSLATLSVPIDVAVLTRYNLPSSSQASAIEVFDLGDGNDILSLVHSNQQFLLSGLLTSPQAYAFAATAFGGGGNDVIWSGNLGDTLYGGDGGDRIDGGGGNDTIFGGAGMDTLNGGLGNDFIGDTTEGGAIISAGGDDDTVFLALADAGLNLAPSTTDNGDVTDGNDKVVLSGDYASASFGLGGGSDVYIAGQSAAAAVDRVDAGPGSDMVSTWSGNDIVDGNTGADVIWGGAGADTIYGGADNDLFYDGADTDAIYGGAGLDVLYFGRDSGAGNNFYDLEREGLAPDGEINGIVVYGLFDSSPDALADDQTVYEADGNIMDNDGVGNDMVYVQQVSGNIYQMDIVGGGATGANIQFDVRDVDMIVLWDNAGASGQYQQHYQWNDTLDTYVRVI